MLLRLRDLGDYETALLMKAKIEACLAAVVTDDTDEALTGAAANLLRDAQGRPVEAFEPGMILYRRGGGSVDVVTLRAVRGVNDTADLVDRLAAGRIAYYRSLSTFAAFGQGWLKRVEQVRQKARGMVG